MKSRKGFTLIELVMVIVILGILAATAIPRFVSLSDEAKKSAAKGALGSIRAAVSIAYATSGINGPAAYPTTLTGSMFAENKIPQEPFSTSSQVIYGATITNSLGWLYSSASGEVFINSTPYSSY